MVVESKQQLQNLFRERLKSVGYRVLVTADPERALTRLIENPKTADCVLFSTSDLGEAALSAFNRLGEEGATKRVPAVLLLGEHHQALKEKAKVSQHRVTMSAADQAPRIARRVGQAVGRKNPAIVGQLAARPDGESPLGYCLGRSSLAAKVANCRARSASPISAYMFDRLP